MYLALIVLLMAVLPLLSIVVDYAYAAGDADLIVICGRWFVFWAVGIRLLLAGIRQTVQPSFTAETIFRIKDPAAHKIVSELGFGNLAIGLLGVLSLFRDDWLLPAAISGGLFYGLAGIKHVLNSEWTETEIIAMISDLAIFAILAFYVAAVLLG